jgi:hypothetical protein
VPQKLVCLRIPLLSTLSLLETAASPAAVETFVPQDLGGVIRFVLFASECAGNIFHFIFTAQSLHE